MPSASYEVSYSLISSSRAMISGFFITHLATADVSSAVILSVRK